MTDEERNNLNQRAKELLNRLTPEQLEEFLEIFQNDNSSLVSIH